MWLWWWPIRASILTPDLLGGGKTVMLGNLVQNQFTTARDWPFGSAASLVLMLASALLLEDRQQASENASLVRTVKALKVRLDAIDTSVSTTDLAVVGSPMVWAWLPPLPRP